MRRVYGTFEEYPSFVGSVREKRGFVPNNIGYSGPSSGSLTAKRGGGISILKTKGKGVAGTRRRYRRKKDRKRQK